MSTTDDDEPSEPSGVPGSRPSSKPSSKKGLKSSSKKSATRAVPPPPVPSDEPSPQEVEAEPFDAGSDPGPTFDVPPAEGEAKRSFEDNLWPTLCHLSPLLGWVFALSGFGALLMPFLWIAAPLLVWQTQKSDPRVDDQGREVLNFQLNIVALSVILAATCIGTLLIPVLWIAGAVFSLVAAIQTSEGKQYRYPFIYRVIRD